MLNSGGIQLTKRYQMWSVLLCFLPNLNHLAIVKKAANTRAEWLVDNLQPGALDMVKYTRVGWELQPGG